MVLDKERDELVEKREFFCYEYIIGLTEKNENVFEKFNGRSRLMRDWR
jgi:hypothetical protein